MPEVREVLETHLDVTRDPSHAVRAVFGQWFPWFVLLDEQWARKQAARIFPLDEQQQAYFEAAWNTYLVFCQPYDNVFAALREQYIYAVGQIAPPHEGTGPDQRLAEHLMTFYWRGKLSIDNPLLIAFWKKASDALRGHALSFVGQALQRTDGEVPDEILERLKQLWASRLTQARQSPADFLQELASFGWWFVSGKFQRNWAIVQLLESLELAGKTEPTEMVLEYLAETVKTHPVESVKCLRKIAEGDREGWELSANCGYVRTILKIASQDPSARADVEGTIHYLGSRGFLEFKGLLEDGHEK